MSSRLPIAAAGVLAAIGLSAIPLLSVWRAADTTAHAPTTQILQADIEAGPLPDFSRLVVDFADGTSDATIADVGREYGLDFAPNSIVSSSNRVFTAAISDPNRATEMIERLRTDSRVEAAEPEMRVSLSPTDRMLGFQAEGQTFDGQWIQSNPGENQTIRLEWREKQAPRSTAWSPFSSALGTRPNDPRYSEQWNFEMIHTESAWEKTRGKDVVVAVIDTGVSKARDFNTTSFVAGYNFVKKTADAADDHGHGTHVAGTIAESTNNNEGVAGIAFEASIMPLKVLGADGSGTAADIGDAIRWAADHGANVINMSLGSNWPSDVMRKACQYARKKGVTIVCAAGNSFGGPVGYPAAYPECIAVSAVGPTGALAKYSSFGKEVALAAPGGDMIDSKNPADGILQNTVFDGKDDYYAFNGTSMASPHVAGVAALIVSQGIKDPAKVKDVLTQTAKPSGDKKKFGAGILDAGKATAKADAENRLKLRHFLAIGLGALIVAAGGRRKNLALRMVMAGGLAAGFFAPDFVTRLVGADSAWNLIGFSALVPAGLIWLSRRGPAVKIASAISLGTAVNLWANWNNGTIPFTMATFGDAALPWTVVNGFVALGLALAGGLYAAKRMR